MRRTLATFLAGSLAAAAACSSGGDATDTSPATGASSSEGAGTSTSDGAGSAAGGGGGDDAAEAPDLPGLLDASNEAIPDDDAVRTGRLDNGLAYYVRANDNPGAKAELRLAIRAGSVDELGETTGVAHFVEHMLFNGTEEYPENELVDVLRGFGAAFGADVNASTRFDDTVYTLTVPNDADSLATGLSVLEQWLSFATFDVDQVTSERGVVLDEWRIRTQSNAGRLFDVAADLFLAGTPYEGRTPIGDEASITSMTRDELVAYYDAWYRPGNAAVVVVGDIEVDEVVDEIERRFASVARRADAPPAATDVVFDTDLEPDVAFHVDDDQATVDVEVTLPLPAFAGDGTAAVRVAILDTMIYGALIRRLDQDLAAGEAPFDAISRGSNSLVEPLDAPALYAFTDAAGVDATLEALLTEYVRADRHGFDDRETDLARDEVHSIVTSRFEGRDTTQDRDYAAVYVEDFLTGAGYPSIETEYAIATDILDAITPADLDRRFRARWANSAPHVIVSSPAAVADRMPTRDEVLAATAAASVDDVPPRAEQADLPDEPMAPPDPVEPATVEELLPFDDPFLDPVELVYPNGVRVILNDNDIVDGQVFFQAASPGGSSLVSDADVVDALYAADIVTSSGVAGFDPAELAAITAGRDVGVFARITPYREQFGGSAATADLETAMQLLHLYMTEPRVDEVALRRLRARVGPVVDDPGSDRVLAADDVLVDTRYMGEPRYTVLPEPAAFDTLDPDGVERVWRDRFGNPDGWVFVFTGDLDIDAATDLAGAYLGGLPAGTPERPVDVADPPPAGVVRRQVAAGTGDTASLQLLFTSGVADIDAELRAHADVVTEILSARLTDVLREELAASYSPVAESIVTTDPDPVVESYVSVTGAPGRIAEIAELAVAEIAALADAGPTEREFANATATVREAYDFVDNGTFLDELLADAIDPARELEDYLGEPVALDRVSPASVVAFIREHLPSERYIEVVTVPR